MIELYPTRLIMKTLPKVDRSRKYLRNAYRFIKREKVNFNCIVNYLTEFWKEMFFDHSKVLWPNVKPEIILMDYLFDQSNRIKESEAVLLIILLLDLQEDFRCAVKRSIVQFLLRLLRFF